MLTICNDHHQEICFDGWDCPLCMTKARERQLEDLLEDSRSEASAMEGEIYDLEKEIEELKREVKSCKR